KRDAEVQELSIIGGSNLWKHLDSLEFFEKTTGIEDPLVLKGHMLKIREAAYKIYPYPCIWGYESLKGKTLSHSLYPWVKGKQLSDNNQKIFVDLGTFVGVDLKEVVKDGWDANNVLGIDFHQDKSEMIHSIANFFLSNILLETTLNGAPAEEAQQVLDLRNLKDLNPLNFICVNQLFHLFLEHDQHELAERCVGRSQGGASRGPQSCKRLWKETLGQNVEVVVTTEKGADSYHGFTHGVDGLCWLHWSVVRL
ncbi:hypothetical protein PSHT_05641, partial [Puccinia striiformis]